MADNQQFGGSDGEVPAEDLKFNPITEIGQTGLRRYGWGRATIDEEWLAQLKGISGMRVYREMADSDPVIAAALRTITLLIHRIEWRVEPAQDGDPKIADQLRDLVETALHDMDRPWVETLGEILTCLPYGFSIMELTYKQRQGWNDDPQQSSRHEDNQWGWASWSPRSQDTVVSWIYDQATNRLVGLRQQAPPDPTERIIPLEKVAHFTTGARNGNPQGTSILRSAFRPWWFLKRLQELEGVGIERDLAGLPVVLLPEQYLSSNATADEITTRNMLLKLVQNVRRDSQEGVLFPSDVDPDTGKPKFEFKLMSSGGTRALNIGEAITRYENRIAMSMMADFMLLGSGSSGSWALSTDKTTLFAEALEAVTRQIAEVINLTVIPRLMGMNGRRDAKNWPRLVPGEVNTPNLTEVGAFLGAMSTAGMSLFPNPELEDHLFELARLPKISDDVRADQEEQRKLMEEQFQQAGAPPADEGDTGTTPPGNDPGDSGGGGALVPAAPKPKAPAGGASEQPPKPVRPGT